MSPIIRAVRLCEALYTKVEKQKGLPPDGNLGVFGVDELAILVDHATGSEVFQCVSHNDKSIHIVVRGSEMPYTESGLKDWINNFLSIKVPIGTSTGEIFAHYGYSRAAYTVAPSVMRLINTRPGYSVTLTGHSLGGSVALLLGLALGFMEPANNRFHADMKVITFGQRRVASTSALKHTIDFQHVRVQNGADVACRTPTFPGYGHSGMHVYLPHHVENKAVWWLNPSNMMMLKDRIGVLLGRVSDHSVSGYRNRCELAFAGNSNDIA